jgi:hypothetical protein
MKKLFCLILAVLLLAGCGAQPQQTTVATEPSWDGLHRAQIAGEEIVFEAWEEAGVPTSGNFYLTQDVVLDAAVTVSGDLKLHLNGHTVLAQKDAMLGNLFVVPAGASMTLYDQPLPEDVVLEIPEDLEEDPYPEVPGGKIASNRVFSGKVTLSNIFLVGGELTIAGGHIDASEMNLEDRANGLAVYVQAGGKLNMLDGVITGGTTWSFKKPEDILNEDGEVIGNTAPDIIYGYGGSVYVEKDATFTMQGGTIWRGSAAYGGNVYVDGDENATGLFRMEGGTLLGGESTNWGGNACVYGTMEMADGMLQQGRSYGHGGNIYLTGHLNITGGTLLAGACDINTMQNKRGGNLAVNGLHATVKITNAKILDGTASCKETHGGNIACFGYGAVEFEVGTGTVVTGGLGHRGGNLYIGHFQKDVPLENMDYLFTGVTIGNGQTTYRGSVMCCDTKDKNRRIQVTFTDCVTTVEDPTELNLAIGAGAKDEAQCDVIINGGTWSDGGIHIYGFSTVTCNGVNFVDCEGSGTGTFTVNP